MFFNVPSVISFASYTRLVQVDEDYMSLQQVYEDDCHRSGRPADGPMVLFQKLAAAEDTPQKLTEETQLRIYNEISNLISEQVLAKFVMRMIPSHMHFFAFKKQFCTQLALSSLVGHLLSVGKRTPENLLFSCSGGVLQAEFHPDFARGTGQLEWNEPVPFRLTRNLQAMFSPVWLDGPFNACLTSVAMCLSDAAERAKHWLRIVMRDEAMSWYEATSQPSQPFSAKNEKIKEIAETNATAILSKLQSFGPPLKTDKKNHTQPINAALTELIEAATNPANLSRMDSTWLAPL